MKTENETTDSELRARINTLRARVKWFDEFCIEQDVAQKIDPDVYRKIFEEIGDEA